MCGFPFSYLISDIRSLIPGATLTYLDPHRNSSWIFHCCPKSQGSCGHHSIGPVLSSTPADWVDVSRWGNPRPRLWIWEVTELVSLGHCDCTRRHGVETGFLGSCHTGLALFTPVVRDGTISPECRGQLFHEGSCSGIQWGAGAAIQGQWRAGQADFNTHGSYCTLWYHGPWTSTETAYVAGLWTQRWPLVAAQALMSLWPQWQHKSPDHYDPSNNMAHGHQHRDRWLTQPQASL